MSSTERVAPNELTIVRDALVDDYEVIEELGRGGMAVVYRARERALDRDVAIKVLPLTRVPDRDLVERFQREARTSAQLEHPNIVPIYRVGQRDAVIFFVMKLLRGQSLAARLEHEGTLPAHEVRRTLLETGSALGYAAKCGVVHRDVKPDNIVLDLDGRCVVTDFGIARSLSAAKLTATGMSVGTPRYMSPEQARAKEVDGRSDIYSLGIVAYECLIGRTPFDGDDAFAILLGHIQSPIPRPRLASDDERALFAVIERMLAKRPDDRFQNASELIAALEATATPSRHEGDSTRRSLLDSTEVQGAAFAPAVDEDDATGPRASPALDAAVRAGVELLRRQRPKVEARLMAGRALVEAEVPHGRSGAVLAVRRIAEFVSRVGLRTAVACGRLWQMARSRGRRFWLTTAAVGWAIVPIYYGVHFATMHRSRCATVVAPTGAGALDDSITAQRARAFGILVDAIGTPRIGSDLDVYYDVCGLENGTSFKTRVVVVKSESGIRRLFGKSVSPIVVAYDETASGPAVRRHRTLRFDGMPAGSYTLNIVVTDIAGRRREKGLEFQVVQR